METEMLVAARALDLDYAVIDAMPSEEGLVILEVNANGVWWFLPVDGARFSSSAFTPSSTGLSASGTSRGWRARVSLKVVTKSIMTAKAKSGMTAAPGEAGLSPGRT